MTMEYLAPVLSRQWGFDSSSPPIGAVVCGSVLAVAVLLVLCLVLPKRVAKNAADKLKKSNNLLQTAMHRATGTSTPPQKYTVLNKEDSTAPNAATSTIGTSFTMSTSDETRDEEQGIGANLISHFAPLHVVGSGGRPTDEIKAENSQEASSQKATKKRLFRKVVKKGKNVYKAVLKIPNFFTTTRSASPQGVSSSRSTEANGRDLDSANELAKHRRVKTSLV